MNRLVIGDIHGCYDEFAELLEKAALTPDDEIIALGDIVDRGPEPLKILNFFERSTQARALKGNHERKHILSSNGKCKAAASQRITRLQIGAELYPAALSFMEKLPHYIELPEAILIHGFLEPGVSLSAQKETVLLGTMSGEQYLRNNYTQSWYEIYDGMKPVIAGHLNYLGCANPFVFNDFIYGIDTSCCQGGALTGIILPEFRIISVRSRKNYWNETKSLYHDAIQQAPLDKYNMEQLDLILARTHEKPELPAHVITRISELQTLNSLIQHLLHEILNRVLEDTHAIQLHLESEHSFKELTVRDQGRLFAQHITNELLIHFIHRARKGSISIDDIKNYFKKPHDVISFAQQLGIMQDNDE